MKVQNAPDKRMQTEQPSRYARGQAADAERYISTGRVEVR